MIPFKRYVKPIEDIETIAKRFGIRELHRLRREFGGVNWRKVKGRAYVELMDGRLHYAELHWYECHGVGKRKMKVKRLLNIR